MSWSADFTLGERFLVERDLGDLVLDETARDRR
jgi:hypothetical protein